MNCLTIDQHVINALKETYTNVIKNIIMDCGNHYGFSGEEAIERLGLNAADSIQIETSMMKKPTEKKQEPVKDADKKTAIELEKAAKKTAMEEEKAAKKAALEAEKAAKKAEIEAEKAAKKAEIEAEKAAKKAEIEAEKAAKKAAIEAEKSAKKAEKPEKKTPKAKKTAQEDTQAPEEEAPKVLKVKRFEHNGVKYLKSSDNILFSAETQDEVGKWNEEKQTIEFNEVSK